MSPIRGGPHRGDRGVCSPGFPASVCPPCTATGATAAAGAPPAPAPSQRPRAAGSFFDDGCGPLILRTSSTAVAAHRDCAVIPADRSPSLSSLRRSGLKVYGTSSGAAAAATTAGCSLPGTVAFPGDVASVSPVRCLGLSAARCERTPWAGKVWGDGRCGLAVRSDVSCRGRMRDPCLRCWCISAS